MKVGKYELSKDQEERYFRTTKEEFCEMVITLVVALDEADARIEELEEEVDLSDDIADDLRIDVELKDKTIRSLVEVCKHLVTRTPA